MSLASRISDLAGAIRDKINLMTPRLLPAGGTTGQFLRKSSATDYAAGWADPPSAGAISHAEALLSADVQLAANNTWYSGPSVSLPAGTWLVIGIAQYQRSATTAAQITTRLWDGSAAHASANAYHASLSGITLAFSLSAIVTFAATTTMTLQMATTAGSATSLMRAAAPNNGQGNNATQILAIRLA